MPAPGAGPRRRVRHHRRGRHRAAGRSGVPRGAVLFTCVGVPDYASAAAGPPGAATHGQRLALLAAHQERIVARLVEMQDDLAVLEKKVEHYRYLIEQGLDCDAP